MGIDFYRQKWSELNQAPDMNPVSLEKLSRQVAYSFLDYYFRDCSYESGYIDLLCEMSTFSNNASLAAPGANALFGIIVESLCDDFESLQTDTYNRLMSQVISYCCRIPQGIKLQQSLNKFGMFSQDDLINRTRKIREHKTKLIREKPVKKIILLSRVTIGADIAITSVMLQRLAITFPDAGIVVIGNSRLKEVYGGNTRIKIQKAGYARHGGLLERLSTWHAILDIIEQESKAFKQEEVILIDPDSRLSQLGVLPLIRPEQYFFFDSRSDTSLSKNVSMPELANLWFNSLSDTDHFCYPMVWVPESFISKAEKFCRPLKTENLPRIIAVNFGVGGNSRKSVGIDFEQHLLLELLKTPKTIILLDKGYGEEETLHTSMLTDAVQTAGFRAADARMESPVAPSFNHGVIAVKTSIGEMAALIAGSDEYIGYDSAFQHISAALNIPCLTVFAGSNNIRFIRRWSAHGVSNCNIVHVDTLKDRSMIDTEDIITRIMHVRTTY